MTFAVFIENPAGTAIKNHHDEKTLEFIRSEPVARPYPYAYGFVIGTTSGDGDNVDCFVIDDRVFGRGHVLECVAVALLEQYQNGEIDHDVIAVPADRPPELPVGLESEVREFIDHVFDGMPDIDLTTGRLLDADAARQFIAQRTDP